MGEEVISFPIDEVLSTDVLVIGSGVAGCCAAIQAARLGCAVILVEKDDVLGGNSGPNLGVHVSGAHSFHPYAGETGIIEELELEAAWREAKIHTYGMHYNIARQWESLLYNKMTAEGVRVFRRNYAKMPIMEGSRIRGVVMEDLATFKTKRIEVRVCVIEASGDGQIAYKAGAEFRKGREGRFEFGERSAPEQVDSITMGTSVTALVRKASHPIPFVAPEGTPPFEPGYGFGLDSLKGNCLYAHSSWRPEAEFCFLWHTETGGQLDTIKNEHEIYEELLKQLYSAWNHIKNEAHIEESRNWELIWVSPKAGKRESRRFLGDYILTQTDVENAQPFPDAVGYGGYAVDVHNPSGARGTQVKVVFHSVPPLYSIPYRCLYSRNVDNLLLTGRLVSVTHLALGTVRLQRTGATLGQAVGAAAALCKKHNCTPRQVYLHHLTELQQTLLRTDATILGVRNQDPDDLARTDEVRATSEEIFECATLTDFLPLEQNIRGVMLWDWERELSKVWLYLKNNYPEPIPVTLNLSLYRAETKWKKPSPHRPYRGPGAPLRQEWGDDNTISAFKPVAQTNTVVEGRFEGWVEFPFNPAVALIEKDPTSDDDRYALTIRPTPSLEWGRHLAYYDFLRRCEASPEDSEYKVFLEGHLLRISPKPLYGEARQVINGYNRRFATNPVNMWISRRDEPLPQSLTLDFGSIRRFDRVHLTFDTFYRSYHDTPINHAQRRFAGMCVRDYELQVFLGETWRTVVQERGNYQRFRAHQFAPVHSSKLRLVVHATNEPGWPARVYEVRIYDSSTAS